MCVYTYTISISEITSAQYAYLFARNKSSTCQDKPGERFIGGEFRHTQRIRRRETSRAVTLFERVRHATYIPQYTPQSEDTV